MTYGLFLLFYLSMIQDLVIHLCFGIPKSIYEVKIITWAWLKKNSNLTQPNQIQIQSNSKSHYLEPILVLVFVEKPEFQKTKFFGKFHCTIGFSSYNRLSKASSHFSVQYLNL